MKYSTLVHFPSKSRPTLFAETFEKWYADDSVRFLITLNNNDPTLSHYLRNLALYDQSRIKIRTTDVKTKIEAINDGVAEEDFGLLIGAQDDMTPMRDDYAKHIRSLFDAAFPEGDGVLWLNDGRQTDLNTSMCMDRKYFDRFGYCYAPQYTSLWADNEFHDVSHALGRSHFVEEVILKHNWVGEEKTGLRDELHWSNEMHYGADMFTYNQRKAKGFPR